MAAFDLLCEDLIHDILSESIVRPRVEISADGVHAHAVVSFDFDKDRDLGWVEYRTALANRIRELQRLGDTLFAGEAVR